MNTTPRKSRQIVKKFERGDQPIAGRTLTDVAKRLRRNYRGGSIEEMISQLQKAVRGNRLFEYQEGGQTFYEPVKARCRRLEVPKGAPKSVYINASIPVRNSEMAVAS